MNSIQRWIYQPRGLSMAARILLPYYCARANGELACFPSYSRTGRDCELSRRSVITGTEELCATGVLSVVTDPVERAAILAAAGTNYNLRVNVYRIGYSKPAHDGEAASLSDGEAATPSRPDGEAAIPSYASLEAKALAMCVPIEPEDGEAASPVTNPEVQNYNRQSVKQMQADGEAASPKLLKELKEPELRARVDAPAREGAPLARTLTGAPGAPREPEEAPSPTSEPAATSDGAPPPPANAFRPPDPFADWLEQGAPASKALALALARPKAIYAPVADRAAARADLARRAAARASP